MKNKILIVLLIAVIVLSGFIMRSKNKKTEILEKTYKNNISRLESEKETLIFDLKDRDIVIRILKEDLKKSIRDIDSIKTLEHEIKTPNFRTIPVDDRNRAIERLASEE